MQHNQKIVFEGEADEAVSVVCLLFQFFLLVICVSKYVGQHLQRETLVLLSLGLVIAVLFKWSISPPKIIYQAICFPFPF